MHICSKNPALTVAECRQCADAPCAARFAANQDEQARSWSENLVTRAEMAAVSARGTHISPTESVTSTEG